MSNPIRIELPTYFGMKTVNCFLFKDPVPTLIDCGEGMEKIWTALEAGLNKEGLQVADIERVVITHAHVDHMGNACRIAETAGAEIWVSDLVYDWATDIEKMWREREKLMSQVLEEMMGADAFGKILPLFTVMATMTKKAWPPVPVSYLKTFGHEGEIELGGDIWQTIYVPGHAANQSCFFNPKNSNLLSADMLLKITPTPVMDVKIGSPNERIKSIFQLLDSYKKIRELDIKKVFPGHYDCFENAVEVIDKQVTRIDLRKEVCFQKIKNGCSDFYKLANEMYGANLHLPAINMLVGYLDLLEGEGRIYYEKNGTAPMGIFPVPSLQSGRRRG